MYLTVYIRYITVSFHVYLQMHFKDKSNYTFNFSLPKTLEISDIRPSTYVTCLYNSFWLIEMVTDVDAVQGDVKVDFMYPHGPRKLFNSEKVGISTIFQ